MIGVEEALAGSQRRVRVPPSGGVARRAIFFKTDMIGACMNNHGGDLLSVSRAAEGIAKAAAPTRAVTLMAADLGAFVLASILALGLDLAMRAPSGLYVDAPTWGGQLWAGDPQWHGWATLLVLAVLLGVFAARGRYTARVPFWTDLGGSPAASAWPCWPTASSAPRPTARPRTSRRSCAGCCSCPACCCCARRRAACCGRAAIGG